MGQAQQNQAKAADQFKEQVNSSNYVPDQSQVNSAIANPTSADPKAFQTWESQSYGGPHSLADSPSLQNQYTSGLNRANTSAKELGSEAGRFSLLDSYFGRPSYSFGEKSLDNLLAQEGGAGKQARNLQNQAATLQGQSTQQAQELQNLASQRAGQVEQSKNYARGAVGLDENGQVIRGANAGALGKQYDSAQAALDQQNQERGHINKTLQGDLSRHALSADDLKSLGLDNTATYGIDPGNYYSPGNDLTINQTLTPEQRSYIQALSGLAGVTDTFASGAAQDKTDPYSFDKARFGNDVSASKAGFEREYGDVVSQVKNDPALDGLFGNTYRFDLSNQFNPASLINDLANKRAEVLGPNSPYNGYSVFGLDQKLKSRATAKIDELISQLNSTMNKYGINPKSGTSGQLQNDLYLAGK